MKYVLTDESITHYGRTLHRIKAVKDFGNVSRGDLGGFVESESNLSQDGNCWSYNNSKVFDYARVYDNAKVYGDELPEEIQIFKDYNELNSKDGGGNYELP